MVWPARVTPLYFFLFPTQLLPGTAAATPVAGLSAPPITTVVTSPVKAAVKISRSAFLTRTGSIHGQIAVHEGFPIQILNRILGFTFVGHFHKSKTAWLA
jgi:hypothetical protein